METPLEIRNYVQANADLKLKAVRIFKLELKNKLPLN